MTKRRGDRRATPAVNRGEGDTSSFGYPRPILVFLHLLFLSWFLPPLAITLFSSQVSILNYVYYNMFTYIVIYCKYKLIHIEKKWGRYVRRGGLGGRGKIYHFKY